MSSFQKLLKVNMHSVRTPAYVKQLTALYGHVVIKSTFTA